MKRFCFYWAGGYLVNWGQHTFGDGNINHLPRNRFASCNVFWIGYCKTVVVNFIYAGAGHTVVEMRGNKVVAIIVFLTFSSTIQSLWLCAISMDHQVNLSSEMAKSSIFMIPWQVYLKPPDDLTFWIVLLEGMKLEETSVMRGAIKSIRKQWNKKNSERIICWYAND
jgi:hypothetical protein